LEKKPYARPWAEWTDFSLAEAITDDGDPTIDIPGFSPGGPTIDDDGEVIEIPIGGGG